MPNSDLRREEPGSLMQSIRRHATELAAYPWATLGIKVPEAQKIVDQIDLMHDRLDRLREEVAKVTRERDSLARRCAVRFESETRLREVLTALNAGRVRPGGAEQGSAGRFRAGRRAARPGFPSELFRGRRGVTTIERFIERHRVARYAFVLASFPVVAISDRVRGIWNAASVEDFRRALRWAQTGEVPGSSRPRPAPARVTTPAERAPLYAAYDAARARSEQIGYRCEDDSIIQHAVRAYETAEIARLRAVLAAVESLTKDTDGGDVAGDADIPIGEIRRVLHEAGPTTAPNPAGGDA